MMMQTEGDDAERVGISAADIRPAQLAEWVKSLVVPRPIAWVGSRSAEGVLNLAPHSFFTMVSSEPPIVVFSSERRERGAKDTLANISATGEFTVNLVTADNRYLANRTSAELPPEESEFEDAGVTPFPSTVVEAPGVLESPATMECRVVRIEEIGSATAIFGEVVHVSVRTQVLTADDRGRILPSAQQIRPVARLGRNEWAELGEVFSLDRPSS